MTRRRTKKERGGKALPRPWRRGFTVLLLGAGLVALSARAVQLQWVQGDMLRSEGAARHLRTVTVVPNRGRILDRNGNVLAVSTPVDALWGHPRTLLDARSGWKDLPEMLSMTEASLAAQVQKNIGREFMYLRRHLTPAEANRYLELGVPGLALQREYRRYYPAGPIAGHVIGFTNVDDRGQEGIERVFDRQLSGSKGEKRVIRDLHGRVVENVDSLNPVQHGSDLWLSIDSRLQFLAHRHLKEAVRRHDAAGGAAVMVDVNSGEVLAMVNEPDFNPNTRSKLASERFRNRAVTDVMEPGSVMKPFTVLAALGSGKFTPDTVIDTSPGVMRIGGRTISDIHDYGELTVTRVLVKSSNIGSAKMALAMGPDALYDVLEASGFGSTTGIELAGERSGVLIRRQPYRDIETATLSYGYGLSATPIQIVRAYAALANGGKMTRLTLMKRNGSAGGKQLLPEDLTAVVREMITGVVSDDGTAKRAMIHGYQVAGKTGTVRKLGAEGYLKGRYQSLFVGFAPVESPRFAMIVVVDDPRGKDYYGGVVAAPVFRAVMDAALRLHDVPPDNVAPGQLEKVMVAAGAET